MINQKDVQSALKLLRGYETKGENLSDEEFHTAVRTTIELGIADEQLSRCCKVSIPTIDRWQRMTAPAAPLRKSVMTVLIQEIETNLT